MVDGRTLNVLKKAATIAIAAVAIYLVVRGARGIDWAGVLGALRNYDLATLAAAFALVIPGQLACACFDLIGRHATRHHIPVPRVMLISLTGYNFSLNLGALIGGLAFRYRLYAPYGLPPMTIAQIIGLSVLTNWSGYVLLAGLVLAYEPPELPSDWGPGSTVLRCVGIGLLVVTAAYLILCATKGGTRVRWKGSVLLLPTLRVAAVQFALSLGSWSVIGALITWLLPGDVGWLTVMPILMISAIAGVWSHIPAGLGIVEVVFVTLLGQRVDGSELLAALFVFRVLYYLVPFLVALAAYAYLEKTARGVRIGAESGGDS
ncbi:MAG TPA: lysylphosphatidylglycerol synthase domain-containing protein [Steroidobacteraceae bacterium]|nr:lysylphosphatidylglycerol synthase domain-containing protein [Steroidobacteraceae bacterium]